MSAPLVPSPLDYVGRRPFAFYPPIRNAHPNAWVIGTSAWTEVQVVNARDGYELWIPRQYIGAVSESDSPLLIVGLTKELDFRNGTLAPRVKRVIEMPHAPEANQQPEQDPPGHSRPRRWLASGWNSRELQRSTRLWGCCVSPRFCSLCWRRF